MGRTWRARINLEKYHHNVVEGEPKEGEFSISEYCDVIIRKVKSTYVFPVTTRTEIEAAFIDVKLLGENATLDDFDEALQILYDEADYYRVWINTF